MSEIFSPGEEPRLLVETVGKPLPAASEINESGSADSPLARLKKYSGRIAATALLSTTLLLSACADTGDCLPVSALPTPPPGSAGFTATQPSSGTSGTYCRSRRTGGYYYSGGGYYGGGSS